MRLLPASRSLPLALLLTALCLAACTPPATEVKLKKWTYIGSGKTDAILPEKARKGGFELLGKIPITKADLTPLEVKIVRKADGKNYAVTSWGGYFWPSADKNVPYGYAVYSRAFTNDRSAVHLAQSQREIMEYYEGKVTSQKAISLKGKVQTFPGREITFDLPPMGNIPARKGILRLYFYTLPGSKKQGKSFEKYRVFAVQAIGNEMLLASETTQQVLNGFTSED